MKSLRAALGVALAALFCASPAVASAPAGLVEKAGVRAEAVGDDGLWAVSAEGRTLYLRFYGPQIFRIYGDASGERLTSLREEPAAEPPARILADDPMRQTGDLSVVATDEGVALETAAVRVAFDGALRMTVDDRRRNATVVRQSEPTAFGDGATTLVLRASDDAWFYGGGVQNGRFSHRGRTIAIENQNSWTDGGVASPAPYYWSTEGYGMMWHTFRPGRYDFGAAKPGEVRLCHDDDCLDLFVMVDAEPAALLRDYYQLTGNPVLLPKFGFYEGHLNAYNRDYWAEDDGPRSVPFEDGKRYRESQRDNGGLRETLNGEQAEAYQFSARAVIDRYEAHDMPLGWLLPNDGYGAGYGQTGTLEGNIENLKQLGEYARARGVETGLWTQSDLHPKEGVEALLQRDIVGEVRDAGVRVLKTDVAWVGAGYSFGLNGIADVAAIMPRYGNDARPFIITLDGWAGTQRYAGVWSGDQTGGEWEYIRFHIPTYIGSGLSGQPNITSDMDGIFGGRNAAVNIRDFQWKTFTPMQLNMDGWGTNEKYPHALGEPAASINRMYLKFKSELMPYAYSIAHEALHGEPMMRAMFLEEANPYTLGTATRYQYMYGPWFLVAPVWCELPADEDGAVRRDDIYLPRGEWIDYFTGDRYAGGRVINGLEAPEWKLPLLVRRGAIIPLVNPNNNPAQIDASHRIFELYPDRRATRFELYDDDGRTQAYLRGERTLTELALQLDERGTARFAIEPTTGHFHGFEPMRTTEARFNVTGAPRAVRATMNGRRVKLRRVATRTQLDAGENVWYYEEAPEMNRFTPAESPFAEVRIRRNPQVVVRLGAVDTRTTRIEVRVEGYSFAPRERLVVSHGALAAPRIDSLASERTAYALTPAWAPVENADCYEVEFEGMLHTRIVEPSHRFGDLDPETDYAFRVRAVNAGGCSAWTDVAFRTADDPLACAIRGLTGRCTAEEQEGESLGRLFDFAVAGELWHTKYQAKAVPFDLTVDLRTVNTLDYLTYVPRENGGNGTLLAGEVSVSMDGNAWTGAGTFEWRRDGQPKEFSFAGAGFPVARFVRLHVTRAVGDYGSGRELYVFRKPGTESYLPGDVNSDGRIDANDLTSYMNYTGLRRGDADFEGYISRGDVNGNGLIDAYDISLVATQIDGGAAAGEPEPVAGRIGLKADRSRYAAGQTVRIEVRGEGLRSVNALSLVLPYDPAVLSFEGVEAGEALAQMEPLTRDRLHSDGSKVLYPTFVNVGDKAAVEGDGPLMVIRMKALRALRASDLPALSGGMLVDRALRTQALETAE